MPSHRWPQITELFHAARARDPATRGSFLTEACQGDQSLRDELERLLGADATAGSFLETSLFPPTDVPRFEPGARLGPYDLKGLLGAGGMGEVFRAHDPRLNRDIAIKVLPLDAAADAERLARFAREAQAIGALNHPNIVTIHSVEQAREVQFLTMELVNGKTLRECIPRGGLPIDRFLDMAIALADAIGTAHLHNVVHRDLKPTNVMVTSEGRVKVLDFGLAKLTPRAAPTGDSATVAPPEPTGEGRVLGTTGYMSPEQAGGGEVDHRSDIFSIGIVLYEMATGQRPFRGESNTSLLSSILEEVPPPVTALRPDLPPALATRIRRCLAKDPNRRYQSALDLRNELDEIRQDLSSGRLAATGGAATLARPRRRRGALQLVLGLVLVGAIAGAAYLAGVWPAPPTARQLKPLVVLVPPSGVQVARQDAAPILAVSPDGRWVAFHGVSDDSSRSGLFLRAVDQHESRHVSEERGASPFFSPDSKWLGFWASGKIWRMRVEGGAAEPIGEAKNQLRGASWGDDGTILFTDGNDGNLWRIAEGRKAAPLTTRGAVDPKYYFPHVLPGSKVALVTLQQPDPKIALVSIDTGNVLHQWFEGSTPRYLPAGLLVFRRGEALFAARFDGENVTGDPQLVLEGVSFNPGGSGTSAFDVSSTGALAYMPTVPRPAGELAWLDRQGRLESSGDAPRDYRNISIDPGGRRLAVHIPTSTGSDLWVYDLKTRTTRPLTRGRRTAGEIVWSPDGRWIVFSSSSVEERSGPALFRIRPEGGTPEEQLTRYAEYGAFRYAYDHACSISDNVLMFSRQTGPDQFDLLTMPLEGSETPKPYVQKEGRNFGCRISPDGRWVAYTSMAAGWRQILVRPLSDPDGPGASVEAPDAVPARWSRDGRSLLYVQRGEILSVPVTPGIKDVRLGKPSVVVRRTDVAFDGLEPSPDGERFFVVKRPPEEARRLVYVENWLNEIQEASRRAR